MRWILIVVLAVAGCWITGADAQQKGRIGVAVETVTPALMAEKNLEFPGGAYVGAVTGGGPAAQAGIEAGDVIFSVNGQAVHSAEELKAAIEAVQPGNKAQLWLGRASQVFALEVQVAALPLVPLLQIDTGGHTSKITGLAFTPDGKYIVSGGDDKLIRIWDWRTGRTIRTIRGESEQGEAGRIYALALSTNGRWLAVGGRTSNNEIRLYDFASGEMVAQLNGHTNVVYKLAFSPDSKKLISGSADGNAIIWDVERKSLLQLLTGHTNMIYAVGFTPDSARAVTGSDDHTLRLWSVSNGQLIKEMTEHRDKVFALTISSKDGTIASEDDSGEIRLWNGKTGAALKVLAHQGGAPGSLSFSPDGRFLLSTCGGDGCDLKQRIYDIAAAKELLKYSKHDNIATASAFSHDGHLVATSGGTDFPIYVWDPKTGDTKAVLKGIGRPVWNVGFSTDGLTIGWGNTNFSQDLITQINNRGPLQFTLRLPLLTNETLSNPEAAKNTERWELGKVNFGKFWIGHRKGGIYGDDNAILDLFWDGKYTGISIEREGWNGFGHSAYSFTPDGKQIISGGGNGNLDLYGLDGREIGAFIGHDSKVWALAPSPDDGRYLVSGSGDQTVRLWSLKTRELLVTIFRGIDGRWVAWTPQGYYAGSPGADNIVGWQINRGADKAADYVTAEQLRDYLYRPDIVDQAIILRSAEQAVREAKDTDRRLEDLLAIERPRFTLAAPERAIGGVSSLTLTLDVTTDPVKDIAISVNGANIPFDKDAVKASAGKGPQTVKVPLMQGKNLIRVSAKNNGGETSKMLEIIHDGEGALDQRGTLYVLAIGVSAYRDLGPVCGDDHKSSCNLPLAGKNAKDFADFVVGRLQSSHQNQPVVWVMKNGAGGDLEPTTANIEKQLLLLKQAKANDTVVLFISGHGDSNDKERSGIYRFFASDTHFGTGGHDFEPGTFVPWPDIDNALNGAYGRKLLFVDTCFSSGAYYKGFGGRAFYANEAAYLSAGPNQKGLWLDEYGGSLFAADAVDAFNGGVKGKITTSGLADYMKGHLQEMLDELRLRKTLGPDLHQDVQYVLGRDAQDFVLAAK